MYRHARPRSTVLACLTAALTATLSACGGGGGSEAAAPSSTSSNPANAPNAAPSANAGTDQQVQGQSTVTLDASASSDSDGTIASFTWSQTAGPAVQLSAANVAKPTFTSPLVDTATVLTFQLIVADNRGATANATVNVSVAASGTVSGNIDFERVPFNNATNGLNYAATTNAPVRDAVVEAISTADRSTILASGATDDSGNYALSFKAGTAFFLRVKAQMFASGSPSWNFRVVNNTNGNALYVLDGEDTTNDGGTHDLHAASGWGTTSYTGERSAAPFAILDAVYQAFHIVLDANPALQFPALDAHWSKTNHDSDTFAPVSGAVGTYYRSGTDSTAGIYLLGTENVDTDEYDLHVIVHEWGHYFQDKFSRDDSLGGSHSIGDRLDPRVAFSEGWGNAFSAMATADPYYRDSGGSRQGNGFSINIESNNTTFGANRGWFSETSTQSIFYDVFDSNDDLVDTLTLGFAPIYTVMTNEVRTSDAMTSLFTFVAALKARNPQAAPQIDAIVAGQNVKSDTIDEFGSTETNNGGDVRNLPIYRPLTVNSGTPIRVCSSTAYGEVNKVGNRRLFKFTIGQSEHVTITAQSDVGKDPDIVLHQKGTKTYAKSNSTSNGRQQLVKTLSPATYVLEVYDAAAVDGKTSTAGNACMDVTVTSP